MHQDRPVRDAAIAQAIFTRSPVHFIDEHGRLRYASASGRVEYSGGIGAGNCPRELPTQTHPRQQAGV